MLMNLPQRLRALPNFDPPAGGWQQLSARMDARRRRWLAGTGGLALAASVLVAVGLVGLRPVTDPPAPAPISVATHTAPAAVQVAQLINRSQRLESQLLRARPQVAVWDSGRARRAALLERELSLVDARLGYSGADPAEVEKLWSTRVALMNALLKLHQNEAPALQYASYQY